MYLYKLEVRKRQAEADKLEAGKTDVGWGHQIRRCAPSRSLRPQRLHRIKPRRTPCRQDAGGQPDGSREGFGQEHE